MGLFERIQQADELIYNMFRAAIMWVSDINEADLQPQRLPEQQLSAEERQAINEANSIFKEYQNDLLAQIQRWASEQGYTYVTSQAEISSITANDGDYVCATIWDNDQDKRFEINVGIGKNISQDDISNFKQRAMTFSHFSFKFRTYKVGGQVNLDVTFYVN
jgi:hypothetical protein